VALARAGEDAVPGEPAPMALRPFLQFARLPAPALVAARRVLDADERFRARVADEVAEEEVGRAGWLFLTRPEGWQDALDALVRNADDARAQALDRRAENEARRRLAAVEAAAKRAEEVADEARAEAERAGDTLADERKARRDAVLEAEKMATRARELQAERDRARAAAASAEGRARAAERELGSSRAELAALRAELGARRAEVGTAPGSFAEPPEGPVPAGAHDPVTTEHAEAGAALGSAARAARGLADALAAAAEALGGEAPTPDGPPHGAPVSRSSPPQPAPPPPSTAPTAPERSLPRARRPPPRIPALLPPAILEDSNEAAEYLARLRQVVLLVDGYNVSLAAWPETPISEQRRRLVDALGELAARTGADVRVVFDGSETVDPPSVATTSRVVRVRFSPPDVEADDVIVAEVAALPAGRPVVVASSDRRVRDESRAHGANLLRSTQLLALLRLR